MFLSNLFQRLVDNGEVPSQQEIRSDSKKAQQPAGVAFSPFVSRQEKNVRDAVSVKGIIYEIELPAGYKVKGALCHLHTGLSNTHFVSPLSLQYLRSTKAPFKIVKEICAEALGLKIIYPLDMLLHRFPGDDVQLEVAALSLSKEKEGKIPTAVYCGRTHQDIQDAFSLDRPGGSRHYWFRWDRRKTTRPGRSLKDLFPKLIKKMTDPDTRFVVSLGGGGLRLFAQPSVFKLIEELGAQDSIEEIWGCSGGAVSGLCYSLGADHEIIEQEGYRVYHKQTDFKFSPHQNGFLKKIFNDLFFPAKAFGMQGFVDITNALQASLARVARHRRPKIPFYALSYNVHQKKNEVLTPEHIPAKRYGGMIKHASPIDAVLASTAVPILFVPRVIRRGKTAVTYIDGGVAEELPLLSIYNKWRIDREKGYTRKKKLFILTVNLFPQVSTVGLLKSSILRRIPLVVFLSTVTHLADLLRQSRIDEQAYTIAKSSDAEVQELTLGDMQNLGFLDPRIIPTVISKAKATFFKQMRVIEKKL